MSDHSAMNEGFLKSFCLVSNYKASESLSFQGGNLSSFMNISPYCSLCSSWRKSPGTAAKWSGSLRNCISLWLFTKSFMLLCHFFPQWGFLPTVYIHCKITFSLGGRWFCFPLYTDLKKTNFVLSLKRFLEDHGPFLGRRRLGCQDQSKEFLLNRD